MMRRRLVRIERYQQGRPIVLPRSTNGRDRWDTDSEAGAAFLGGRFAIYAANLSMTVVPGIGITFRLLRSSVQRSDEFFR